MEVKTFEGGQGSRSLWISVGRFVSPVISIGSLLTVSNSACMTGLLLFYVFVLLAWDRAQQLPAIGRYVRAFVCRCGHACVHAASISHQLPTYKTHGWSACLLCGFANNAHPLGSDQ